MNNSHNYDIERLLASKDVTTRQKEALSVLEKEGTMVKTADALGIRKRTLQDLLSRANKNALSGDLDSKIPNKHTLAGVSTLYKTDEETGKKEEVLQWVKTKQSQQDLLDAMTTVTKEIARDVVGKAIPVKEPRDLDSELLTVYVNTDLHLGQYAWHEETGTDVDLDIVSKNALEGLRLLSDTSPKSKSCLVLDLGDTLHANNDDARTKSGHVLDTDTRHAKVFRTLIDMKIAMIDLALKKHRFVKYIVVAGNHSDLVANYLNAFLSAYYKDEPRFSLDESPALHKYHIHGKTLLGFHHGHSTKFQRLPEVMVWDRKDDISHTDFRYWLTGHVHKDSVVDNPICRMESFRNLTSNDAWATGAGYRGHKQAVSVTYSKDFGEVARNTVNIGMLS